MFFSFFKNNVLKYRELLAFLTIAAVLAILFLRNPFSLRTLIPNLEPYPDTFHYIVPAMNFLDHGSFDLGRPEVLSSTKVLTPSVPFLYTFWLFPFFLLQADPRLFYFANVLLSGISIYLLWSILKKLSLVFEWRVLSLFFFVTSFYTYWLPSLAMAENMLVPIFLLCIWLYLEKNWQDKHAFFAALAATSLYATKYAALPAALVFALAFLHKIWTSKTPERQRQLVIYVTCGISLAIGMSVLDYFFTGKTLLLSGIKSLSSLLLVARDASSEATQSETNWFSLAFFPLHFKEYGYGLMGQAQTFLWTITPFWPTFLAWFGWLGLAYSAWSSPDRAWARVVLIAVLAQWLFMSTFYVVDMRYMMIAFPIMFIGVAVLGSRLTQKSPLLSISLFFVLFSFWTVTHVKPLKLQVALNLKYAEQPWYYVAVRELDTFVQQRSTSEIPVIISPMSPFFLDFYRTQAMEILPLSKHQDFGSDPERLWGNAHDYSNLILLYQNLIDDGREVYVAKYGLGNVPALHQAYAEIESNFTLTEVHQGCFSLCNIYRVTSRETLLQP